MNHHLFCTECSKTYSSTEAVWRCECGGLLDIEIKSSFPTDKIRRRPPSMWRYREALPILSDSNILSFNEGFTPILKENFGFGEAFIKCEHLFPSGSYKDRGSSVLISHCKELSLKHIVEDSSGNAGASVAAYSAAAGIDCDIYVPASNSLAKLAQIRAYGANLFPIEGNRRNTANKAVEAAESSYYASHSWNPYFFQGTKTFAFEVWEQLGEKEPDVLVLPAGNGTLLIGVFLGYKELLNAGMISKMPKIIAVQAENCNPLSRLFNEKKEDSQTEDDRIKEEKIKETIAEGIAIENPVRGHQILEMVRESGGRFIDVSEEEILEALKNCFSKGHFIEPTSAAVIAGLLKFQKHYEVGDQIIVSLFSGHGLKAGNKIAELL